MKIEDRWALITGAGRGIGRAIAVALAGLGHPVALVARSRHQLEEAAAQCEDAGAPKTAIFECDLGNGAAIDELIGKLETRCGVVDILVNNAGMMTGDNADEGDPEQWQRLFAVNLLAPMRLTRRLAPKMIEREHGTIINLGSVAALEGMGGAGVYAASKFGLRGWSLSCYQRLRGYGIKVALINPAYVDTALVGEVPGVMHVRMLRPEDVAQAAVLVVTSSKACCPEEITLRLTRSAYA